MQELVEWDISCPYCGESINVLIDPEDAGQQYVEDCQVCCRPMVFCITEDADGLIQVSVHSEDEV